MRIAHGVIPVFLSATLFGASMPFARLPACTRTRIGTTRITGTSTPSIGTGTSRTRIRTSMDRWSTPIRTHRTCITATSTSGRR